MHYELMNNRVKMWKPKTGNWCNFLIVHQNRCVALRFSSHGFQLDIVLSISVKHSAGNYVPETLFDDSINLVIWGHEHDCRMTPVPVPGKSYRITQPGSSIATSLTDGEAIHKHVLQYIRLLTTNALALDTSPSFECKVPITILRRFR